MALKRHLFLLAAVLGYASMENEEISGLTLQRKKRDATAATCKDRFEAIPGHTMCLANVTSQLVTNEEQQEIVKKHNNVRSGVNPAAANMMKMHYDKTLETEAQIWTEQCKLSHDHSYKRFLPGRYYVGQNIATSKEAMTWAKVIDLWDSEKSKFRYGSKKNELGDVGHYTQLVWATTSLVGCGMAKCGNVFYYVCNYGPSGNVNSIDKPYIRGDTCNSCKTNCIEKLCDCSGKVCYNGGQLDPSTCTCTCNKKLNLYNNELCELECLEKGDNSLCGKRPFNRGSCHYNREASYNCPWLCDICPYAGKNYTEDSVPLPKRSSSSTPALTSWKSLLLLTLSLTMLCL